MVFSGLHGSGDKRNRLCADVTIFLGFVKFLTSYDDSKTIIGKKPRDTHPGFLQIETKRIVSHELCKDLNLEKQCSRHLVIGVGLV